MSRFPVEQGIPMPPAPSPRNKNREGGRPPKYPWARMAVGESFYVGPHHNTPDRMANLVRMHNATHPETHFEHRTIDGGSRVWRTA